MFKNASKFFQNMSMRGNEQLAESDTPSIPRVYNEPYFYGRITRAEGEAILSKAGNIDGLYLLRESITPMGNFSLSMVFEGNHLHYSIEKQVDGMFMIPAGQKFKDPVQLIEFYKINPTGLVTAPRVPCNRHSSQEAIAYRGLSYQDLHLHMRTFAKKINADPSKALGSMHDTMMLYVLRNIHESLPWYHGKIDRNEAKVRLEQSSMEDGIFMVRLRPDSDTSSSFALTMIHEGELRHYIITCSDGENYHIDNGPRFKALVILIDHYHSKRDGLPCSLKSPCCNPDFKHQAWERYKRLSVNITHHPPRIGNGQPSASSPQSRSPSRLPPPPPPIPSPPPPPPPVGLDSDEEKETSETVEEPCPEEAQELEKIYIDIRSAVMSNKLKPENIVLEEKLGSGQFGDVMKGKCYLGDMEIPVAVKTLKDNNAQGQKEIESEATLMKRLDHPHIVRMIGVCSAESLMLVMELAEFGPLKKYLTRNQFMTHWHRLELMIQICEGMAYLESKAVVHRDLATRNVLLLTQHFAKISDFGMSRIVDSSSQYYTSHAPGRWPLIWYAPECLYYHKFDSKSDVWSFGVTMWEIMSNGKRPYQKMQPPQILQFLDLGNRLAKPNGCEDGVYMVMNRCWEYKKENRPKFTALQKMLVPLYEQYYRQGI